jgi:excisionase family DNA binding protein
MSTAMAARYLSLDENSFALLTQREGVRPVELGLSMVRWRRTELDRLVSALPTASTRPIKDAASEDPDRAEFIAKRIAEELARRAIIGDRPGASNMGAESFSIAETAKVIGISKSTLYKLIAEGRLETMRIGGRRLVRRAAIQALLSTI